MVTDFVFPFNLQLYGIPHVHPFVVFTFLHTCIWFWMVKNHWTQIIQHFRSTRFGIETHALLIQYLLVCLLVISQMACLRIPHWVWWFTFAANFPARHVWLSAVHILMAYCHPIILHAKPSNHLKASVPFLKSHM